MLLNTKSVIRVKVNELFYRRMAQATELDELIKTDFKEITSATYERTLCF